MLNVAYVRYNSSEHPVPFHKAQELGKATKKLAGGPAPDLEDVFDVRFPFCFFFLYSDILFTE